MNLLQRHARNTLFKTAITTVLRRCRKTASKGLVSSIDPAFMTIQELAIDADRAASSPPRVQNTAQPLTALPRRSS